MNGLKAVVETADGDYQTEVKSVAEFREIVKQMNVSGDNQMIMIGSLAIRAGVIRSITIDEG